MGRDFLEMRASSAERKERAKEAARKFRAEHPELHRARVRKSRQKSLQNDPDTYRKQDLQKRYGVSIDWYYETLEKQEFACAICKKPASENASRHGVILRLAVDHCNESGVVRGLLCNDCNRGIGMLGHDSTILSSAIKYLAATTRGLT